MKVFRDADDAPGTHINLKIYLMVRGRQILYIVTERHELSFQVGPYPVGFLIIANLGCAGICGPANRGIKRFPQLCDKRRVLGVYSHFERVVMLPAQAESAT